jgi:hypothetical protein
MDGQGESPVTKEVSIGSLRRGIRFDQIESCRERLWQTVANWSETKHNGKEVGRDRLISEELDPIGRRSRTLTSHLDD